MKDILIKYEITFPDSNDFQLPKIAQNNSNDKHIRDYFNDSMKSIFFVFCNYVDPFFPFREEEEINLHFYNTNQAADTICSRIFNNFIRDKFTVYDSKIFENKLPYSSYVESIKRDHAKLERKLESKNITPLRIESPILKMDVKSSFWYYLVCWILCLVSWLTRNIFSYRDDLIKKLKIGDNNDLFDRNLNPSFLNLIMVGFNHHNIFLIGILTLAHLTTISVLWFYVFKGYHDLIFENDIAFFLLSILPIIITLIVLVWFYTTRPLQFLKKTRT
ncbi:MAG: hypothetical protein HN356_12015 [Calditrichaeota bacterium]|nr:hypothetical protein [Calditrichota bacterium]